MPRLIRGHRDIEDGLGGVPQEEGALESGVSEDEGQVDGGLEGDAELLELDEGLHDAALDHAEAETGSTATVPVTTRLTGRRVSAKAAATTPMGKPAGAALAGSDAIAADG